MQSNLPFRSLFFPFIFSFTSIIMVTGQDNGALLDLSSDSLGLLIPRMTTAQREAINNPAQGLMVYDSTTNSFWFYDESWKKGLGVDDQDWTRNGNQIYNEHDSIAIGTGIAKANVHLAAAKNVLFGDDVTGSGFKLLWYGNKGAFRAGYLTNPFGGYNYDKFWDYDSVGYYSFAAGQNSFARGFGSFAFGSFGWALGSSSVAFFGQARGNGSYSFGGNSIGRGSFTVEGTAQEEGGIAMYGYTGGRYGVSIGGGTTGLGASSARKDYGVAIGWNADARGQASVSLGPNDAYGYNAFSTGWVTEARGNYSSTFGYRTNSYPYASMALGRYNVITGDSATWRSTDPIFMIGDGTSNTNRSNSFMVQKNGQTAVGYNAPTGMLNVSTALGTLNGGGSVINTSDAAILIGTTSTGMAFDANQIESIGDELHFNFNSTEDVLIAQGGGNVGIGLSLPTFQLQLSTSSAGKPGGGSWTNSSDIRLKKNISAFQDGLASILKINPVRYQYNNISGYDTRKEHVGVIAQELGKVAPYMIVPAPIDGIEYLHVDNSAMTYMLINAVKELHEENTFLKEQFEILRSQVLELTKAQLSPKMHDQSR